MVIGWAFPALRGLEGTPSMCAQYSLRAFYHLCGEITVKEINVNLSVFTVASTKGEGYSLTIDPDKWTPEYVAYLCEYAVGVIVQRSTASLTDKAGHDANDREKARAAVVQKINDGIMGRVAGGLSREDAALRDALEAQGFKFLRIPTGEKTEKGNDKTTAEPVGEAFARFVAELAEKAGKEVDEDVTAAVLDKLKSTTAYKAAMGDIDDSISL